MTSPITHSDEVERTYEIAAVIIITNKTNINVMNTILDVPPSGFSLATVSPCIILLMLFTSFVIAHILKNKIRFIILITEQSNQNPIPISSINIISPNKFYITIPKNLGSSRAMH